MNTSYHTVLKVYQITNVPTSVFFNVSKNPERLYITKPCIRYYYISQKYNDFKYNIISDKINCNTIKENIYCLNIRLLVITIALTMRT